MTVTVRESRPPPGTAGSTSCYSHKQHHLKQERCDHTLQGTALVQEAFLQKARNCLGLNE
jgi:hypothetical protein